MVLDLIYVAPNSSDDTKSVLVESQKKRFADPEVVNECVELYKKWKTTRGNLDTNNMNRGIVIKKLAEKKKQNKEDPCTDLMEEKKKIEEDIKLNESLLDELWLKLKLRYNRVGNIVHESVPVEKDEKFNKIEKTWGTPRKMIIEEVGKPGAAHHHEILRWIDGFDPVNGSKISGHRGYFLKGYGVLLNQALLSYGLSFLTKNKYTPVQTPLFMKQSVMEETCQLSDFEENLYK